MPERFVESSSTPRASQHCSLPAGPIAAATTTLESCGLPCRREQQPRDALDEQVEHEPGGEEGAAFQGEAVELVENLGNGHRPSHGGDLLQEALFQRDRAEEAKHGGLRPCEKGNP